MLGDRWLCCWAGCCLMVWRISVLSVGGETEEERIRVDILENEAMDTSNQLATVCYSPDFVSPLLRS